MTQSSEKVQKILADAGLGSRREIERWIAEGRISVNGREAKIGDRALDSDRFQLDGKPIAAQDSNASHTRVLIYNKPMGEICTRSDPENRPTVFNKLPQLQNGRWIVIGRLDINTSGLLLFTTDGELANKLMHPSSEMDREYVVRVMGAVEEDAIERMKGGVILEDGEARFTDITRLKNKSEEAINQWFCCTLIEGRNREVRRLWESQGYKVSRLKRVRFGPVNLLAKVKEGGYIEMQDKEVKTLYSEVGLKPKSVAPLTTKAKEKLERHERKAKTASFTRKSQSTRSSTSKKPVSRRRDR